MNDLRDLKREVQELKQELHDLQNKVNQLTSQTIQTIQKKQTNICLSEYLNLKPVTKEQLTMDKWLDKIKVLPEHLETVFANDLIHGILSCIKSNLIIPKFKMPIIAFTEKKNTIYVFTNDTWMLLDNSYLHIFLLKLSQKFTQTYIKWLTENNNYSIETNISNQIKIITTEKLLSPGNITSIYRWYYINNNIPYESYV